MRLRSILTTLFWLCWNDFNAWRKGVTSDNYRELCVRCGTTGQAHLTGEGCQRIKR